MRHRELKVSDLMTTAVTTIRASQPLHDASDDMAASVIRHLPVLDDRGRLVGMLSDRDLLRATGAKKTTPIAELMSRDVISTRPDTPAHAAATTMLDHQISGLPVLDEDGGLVGMITQTDFVELARRALLGLPLARG